MKWSCWIPPSKKSLECENKMNSSLQNDIFEKPKKFQHSPIELSFIWWVLFWRLKRIFLKSNRVSIDIQISVFDRYLHLIYCFSSCSSEKNSASSSPVYIIIVVLNYFFIIIRWVTRFLVFIFFATLVYWFCSKILRYLPYQLRFFVKAISCFIVNNYSKLIRSTISLNLGVSSSKSSRYETVKDRI